MRRPIVFRALAVAAATSAAAQTEAAPPREIVVSSPNTQLVATIAPAGKRRSRTYVAIERQVTLEAAAGARVTLTVRVADDVLKAFIDLAAEMGWEYSLVDANWHLAPQGTIERVVAYAKDKRIGLWLWYNSAGPHNDVTEWGPRDRITEGPARRAEFARLKTIGIAGVKVDFWHSDKQAVISLYHDMMADAAQAGLLIAFHGATTPRGWSRTYPNLLAVEAVLSAEQYKYNERYAGDAAWHNTILAFTRNVIGSMDYLPAALSDAKYPHQTTNAHELALTVVSESGIVHFPGLRDALQRSAAGRADAPEARAGGVARLASARRRAGTAGDNCQASRHTVVGRRDQRPSGSRHRRARLLVSGRRGVDADDDPRRRRAAASGTGRSAAAKSSADSGTDGIPVR